jgi:hypothetical protein
VLLCFAKSSARYCTGSSPLSYGWICDDTTQREREGEGAHDLTEIHVCHSVLVMK